MPQDDTIAAIATPPGSGGIAVARLSGPDSWAIAERLLPPTRLPLADHSPGTFFHTSVRHPVTREKLDDAIVLLFRAPKSYTGEDVVELQGHGGGMQSSRLLDALLAAGARLANPGEFTQRAFLNGRIDLTQAEAVCDLIQSRSESAARLARAQLDGSLGSEFNALYDALVAVAADVEHVLDFDEGELPDSLLPGLAARLETSIAGIDRLAATRREGQLLRDGALVVICGEPNVGKSSLMNALLRQNRAIVNARPGTTRDAIEETCVIGGVPVRLADTAGLRETDDEIEREGIERARRLIATADLTLELREAGTPQPCADIDGRTIRVLTKIDLFPAVAAKVADGEVAVSAHTGAGLDELKRRILRQLGVLDASPSASAVSARHAEELATAKAAAFEALGLVRSGPDGLVLAAMRLRSACEALGRVTGREYSEDLLDRVFSKFCVGK